MRFGKKQRDEAEEPADDARGPEADVFDVEALVELFVIDPDAAAHTRRWTPSRRGNSPRHGS